MDSPSRLAISSKSGGKGLAHSMERGPYTVLSSTATDMLWNGIETSSYMYTCTQYNHVYPIRNSVHSTAYNVCECECTIMYTVHMSMHVHVAHMPLASGVEGLEARDVQSSHGPGGGHPRADATERLHPRVLQGTGRSQTIPAEADNHLHMQEEDCTRTYVHVLNAWPEKPKAIVFFDIT